MENNYVTISQINNYIKTIFDQNNSLKKVYLKGEISNYKRHTTGHLYLTLKDDNSKISAIMFKSSAASLLFEPEDGMNVLVEGRISVYPAGGSYQIYIDKMREDGLGDLYVRYEQLKKELQKQGLFDVARKRPIPKYPTTIGIVTAPTGAAIKDILSTIKRRYPMCKTILFPALVQGISAAPSVASQIRKAQEYDIDTLIVGRGGGSIEDLWAFNEEIVARAIYESRIPVISAVGHEVDFTIADYVADLRAPTPTGAAEMAVPTVVEVKNIIKNKEIVLTNSITSILNKYNHKLNELKNSYILKNPLVLYDVKLQKLDSISEALHKNIKNLLDTKKLLFKKYCDNYYLNNPDKLLVPYQNNLKELVLNLDYRYKYYLEKKDNSLQYVIQTLKLVNPLNILDKGYSLIMKDNKTISDIKKIKKDDNLDIKLKDGNLKVLVKEIEYERK